MTNPSAANSNAGGSRDIERATTFSIKHYDFPGLYLDHFIQAWPAALGHCCGLGRENASCL
jgi:hypothetical protein